jgi:hypothetical protein
MRIQQNYGADLIYQLNKLRAENLSEQNKNDAVNGEKQKELLVKQINHEHNFNNSTFSTIA